MKPSERTSTEMPAWGGQAISPAKLTQRRVDSDDPRSTQRTINSRTIPKRLRPRCGARCRSRGGEPCLASVCFRPDGTMAQRCRMHGGLSRGARTPEGRAKLIDAGRRGAIVRWERAKLGAVGERASIEDASSECANSLDIASQTQKVK